MIIATHPGRHGDILWALPTVRALAAAYGEPIHLRLSAKYGSSGFRDLLRAQPYLASVRAVEDWVVEESAPIGPRVPALSLDDAPAGATVYHLGYEDWPHPHLPGDVHWRAKRDYEDTEPGWTLTARPFPELDLHTPWLRRPNAFVEPDLADLSFGFTDEHFELKYGLSMLVAAALPDLSAHPPLVGAGSRWEREGEMRASSWVDAARMIHASKVFLGCCSALHVLAVGLGVPAIVMEPNVNRLQGVFWPVGYDGPQVRLVRGLDGLATHDARHCAQAIQEALR